MRFELKLTGVDGVIDMLRRLPPEVVSRNGGVVRSALRKGAVVILKQAQANLQKAVANSDDEGKRYSTGLLLKNLVVTRGKAPTSGKGERQLVRVRRKSYDGAVLGKKQKAGDRRTTLKTAQLLEYGSSQQPAEPWLRPAFSSRAEEAIRTVETELVRGIDRAVKKLAKQGGR